MSVRKKSPPRVATPILPTSADAAAGMDLALELLQVVRAQFQKSGLVILKRNARGRAPYVKVVDRYLRRARTAGAGVERGFTQLLKQLAEIQQGETP